MSSVTQLITAETLLNMPRDGMRHELVKGELRTMTPAGFDHGAHVVRLTVPLAQYVASKRLGIVVGAETGFLIRRDPDTVLAPDIAFVRQERIPPDGNPMAFFPGAPDLAVEVLSPGDKVFEVEEKVEEWLNAGTAMVWVVNPRRRTVTVYRSGAIVVLMEKDPLDGQDVVPGFRYQIADIFA